MSKCNLVSLFLDTCRRRACRRRLEQAQVGGQRHGKKDAQKNLGVGGNSPNDCVGVSRPRPRHPLGRVASPGSRHKWVGKRTARETHKRHYATGTIPSTIAWGFPCPQPRHPLGRVASPGSRHKWVGKRTARGREPREWDFELRGSRFTLGIGLRQFGFVLPLLPCFSVF